MPRSYPRGTVQVPETERAGSAPAPSLPGARGRLPSSQTSNGISPWRFGAGYAPGPRSSLAEPAIIIGGENDALSRDLLPVEVAHELPGARSLGEAAPPGEESEHPLGGDA